MAKRLYNKYGQATKIMLKLDPKLRKLEDKFLGDLLKLFPADVDYSDVLRYASSFADLAILMHASQVAWERKHVK